MSEFTLNNLLKQYGKKTVLDIPHLEIEKNKIYSVIGPSGAGKSTLLRLLALSDSPSQGEILFRNNHLNQLNSSQLLVIRRKITLLLQTPYLFHDTVANNISLGLKIRHKPKEYIKQKTQTILDFIGMSDFAHRQAHTLSGGEGQRVALARAIALEPDILLLDEPTANLDPQNVQIVEQLIANINKEFNTTIILITHNLFQAQRVSDYTMFLYEGQLIEMSETQNLFTQPQNPLTQKYLSGQIVY